jgi:hypothetical protein
MPRRFILADDAAELHIQAAVQHRPVPGQPNES